MRRKTKLIYTLALFLGDISLYYFSFKLSYFVRFKWQIFTSIFPPLKGIPDWSLYYNFFQLTVVLWIISFLFVKVYREKYMTAMDELVIVFKGTTFSTLLIMALTFIYRGTEFSRFAMAIIWLTSSALIYAWHEAFKTIFQLFFRRSHNALIIGNSEKIEFIKKILRKHRYIKPHFMIGRESINGIMDFVRSRNIDEIYTTSSLFNNREEFMQLVDRCEIESVEIKIVPDILQMSMGETVLDDSFGMPVFHMRSISLTGLNFYYKRVFDILIAITVLSLTVPITILAILLIKLDSHGPIFYLHKRMGYKGNVFSFFKFRTMTMDADALLDKIKHLSERKGPVFKMKNDPRVTRFGKFLRRYSVDELPQLINVLRGEMSIVGPRPQVLWEASVYDDHAKKRLRIMPGITGLWQVSGRASLSYEEMINLDIFYIENWSTGLDLKIISRTLPAIFSKKGTS